MKLRSLLAGTACAVACVLGGSGLAQAAVPPILGEFGPQGTGAGGIVGAHSIAVDPTTKHLLVLDSNNTRVEEYTAWGEFVKAFGWDVSPGPVDEEQEVRVRASSGQFKLEFDGAATADLPFAASAAEVEAALSALPSIGGAGGAVSVRGGPAGIAGTTPAVWVVRFEGALAATDLPPLTVLAGSTPVSGGNPTTAVAFSRADGGPSSTGLEACTQASGCKAGSVGTGAGQLGDGLNGIAVAANGRISVYDLRNFRVQQFDRAGEFLRTFGRGVNATTGADICSAADLGAGDECGAGQSSTAAGGFSQAVGSRASDSLAESPDGQVLYVGEKDRIQEFSPTGAYLGELDFASIDPNGFPFPASGNSGSVAVDPVSADIYFTFTQGIRAQDKTPGVFRIDPSRRIDDVLFGAPEGASSLEYPEALATDGDGSVYVGESFLDPQSAAAPHAVIQFAPDGSQLIRYETQFALESRQIAVNSAGNVYTVKGGEGGFRMAVYGPPPVALEPPPVLPPTIGDQFASRVGPTDAELRTTINPRFWADTRYFVEYGSGDCEQGGCAKEPLPPGELLTAAIVEASLPARVSLAGLAPGTTYHYRFVAQGSGGLAFGPDSSFTTAKEPAVDACPNGQFRAGAGEVLPDCRAYELVSPLDKGGGDVLALCEYNCNPASLEQGAEAGGKLTYSAYRAFGAVENAPYSSQYLSSRGPGGWGTENLSAPQSGMLLFEQSFNAYLDTNFKAFDANLEQAWLVQPYAPELAPEAEGPSLYRRDLASGAYEALVANAGLGPEREMRSYPEVQGVTPDGRCAIFRVKAELTNNAKEGLLQLYESCEGRVSLVSILPNKSVSLLPSSAGTPSIFATGRGTSVFNAISDDGTRVFWSQSSEAPGPLYLRMGKATIVVASGNATFWGAAADGSRVIYELAGSLYDTQIDAAGQLTTTEIAGQAIGVVGMSENASRVYFVSKEVRAGGARAGEPNLYLHEAGGSPADAFVATLAAVDPGTSPFSPTSIQPVKRAARVSADGLHAVFMSRAPLTGFDNTDAVSGKADAEVFRYDAAAAELDCISCNPTGVRPSGRELVAEELPTGKWGAAKIPTFTSQLYGSRVIAAGGDRIYFESFEPLDPRDRNGVQDVYQWEEPGSGGCEESDPSFQPSSGGCVNLISDGTGERDARFVDASASGDDVFIATATSLVDSDPGLVDIYDARVGGGFPTEATSPECEGEGCQPREGAPGVPMLPSSASGPGNPSFKPKPCRKGSHKVRKGKKARCVRPRGPRHCRQGFQKVKKGKQVRCVRNRDHGGRRSR